MAQQELFPIPVRAPTGHELTDVELADMLRNAMLTSGVLTARADLTLCAISAEFLVNRLRLAGAKVYTDLPCRRDMT